MPKRRVDGDSNEADVLADVRTAEAQAAAAARAAELRKLADQVEAGTAAWDKDGAGGAETEIVVVDYPSTGVETVEAWSDADDEPEDDGSWRGALSRAALPLFVLALIAFGAVVVGLLVTQTRHEDNPTPATAPTTQAAPTAPLPTASLPPIPTGPVAKDPHDDEFVAMALSPKALATPGQIFGGFGTSGTQENANKIAITECKAISGNDDCLLVNGGMFHGCVSYAISQDSPKEWAGGTGPDPDAAKAAALGRLARPGAVSVQCSDPPGLIKAAPAAQTAPAPPPAQSRSAPAALPPNTDIFNICPDGHEGVVGGHTSCAFAVNVRQAFYATGMSNHFTALSPITGDGYDITCVGRYTAYFDDGSTKVSTRCYGGDNAEVVIW